MDFSKIEDSLRGSGALDTLKKNGVSEVNFSFDTATYIMNYDMLFIDMVSFTNFMNKDRADSLKPIELTFNKNQFSVKNCASLIAQEMMEAFNKGGGDNSEGGMGDMNMNDFFKFKTTYHFPYEVAKYKSESGKGLLSEDKKSITIENAMNDFSDSKFNGDLTVNFK